MSYLPIPDNLVGVQRKIQKKRLITKTRKDENTKKNKTKVIYEWPKHQPYWNFADLLYIIPENIKSAKGEKQVFS